MVKILTISLGSTATLPRRLVVPLAFDASHWYLKFYRFFLWIENLEIMKLHIQVEKFIKSKRAESLA